MNWDKGKVPSHSRGLRPVAVFCLTLATAWTLNQIASLVLDAHAGNLLVSLKAAEFNIDCGIPLFWMNPSAPYARFIFMQTLAALVFSGTLTACAARGGRVQIRCGLAAGITAYCAILVSFVLASAFEARMLLYPLYYSPGMLAGYLAAKISPKLFP